MNKYIKKLNFKAQYLIYIVENQRYVYFSFKPILESDVYFQLLLLFWRGVGTGKYWLTMVKVDTFG